MAIFDEILGDLVARAENATSTTTSAGMAQTSATNGTNDSNNNNNNNGGGGGSNSPLLFFVALGFGVVFTNLWIIVGVKYCFRYNARNRARALNEDGEPVPLENMPRPHRRRREKKLMTIDEVNDKFPMMKYKTWVSERAREGLPTAGGVSVPASRAESLRDAGGAIPPLVDDKERSSADATVEHEESGATKSQVASPQEKPLQDRHEDDSNETGQASGTQDARPDTLDRATSRDEDEDDDDEQINAALPPELLAAPGDTCAICIDTLEDDEDVRGLTCGHAFHAVCVDPWLTSRRACCPLCKADYYTPKPRPDAQGENAGAGSLDPRHNTRLNLPGGLGSAWFRGAGRSRVAGRGQRNVNSQQSPSTGTATATDGDQTTETVEASQTAESTQQPNHNMMSSVRNALSFGRRRHNHAEAGHQGSTATDGSGPEQDQVTPSQLEAGTRSTANPSS